MKNIIVFLLFVFFLIPSRDLFAGGGWPQPKGGGYFKLSEWWLIADQHFTDIGRIDPNQTTGLFNTALYAEYGFTDRLTGVLYFPFFSRTYINNQVSFTTGEIITPGEALNTIGDVDISLQYGLFSGNGWAVSANLTLGLPLGENAGGESGTLQTGDGEFNQFLRVDVGKSFPVGELYGYANAYGGFNNRTKGFSDEIRFGIEAGLTFLNNKVTALARLYGIRSLRNGTLPSDQSNPTSIFANNSEHLTVAPEVAYHFNEKWGVSAGFAKALSGKIMFANTSYTVGVFLKI